MDPIRDAPRRHRGHGRPQRGLRLSRRHVGVVVGLLVGSAVMLIAATLKALTGTEVPVLSNLAAAPVPDGQVPVFERKAPPATPGSCLSWRRPDAGDAQVVDCSATHLFEQAGRVALTDFAPDAPLPDNQRFRLLVNEKCTPLVNAYLGGRYDPSGAFRAGALKPSQKSWGKGDRDLRCGLQRFSRSGALYPIVGKVAEQDQADVRQPGTCLGIDGRFIGDPVDCALPHAVESVGWIDLGSKFKDKYPAVGDQDGFLQPQCTKVAADYAGGPDALNSKRLSVLWDNLSPESWNAGTRKVACNLAAQLPDRSGFAAVTGSVKGPVQIANQVAPPAPVVAPGAPARVPEAPPADLERAAADRRAAVPQPPRQAEGPAATLPEELTRREPQLPPPPSGLPAPPSGLPTPPPVQLPDGRDLLRGGENDGGLLSRPGG